jgi:hypothetical protein
MAQTFDRIFDRNRSRICRLYHLNDCSDSEKGKETIVNEVYFSLIKLACFYEKNSPFYRKCRRMAKSIVRKERNVCPDYLR